MIIDFTLKNYRSFKERAVFSMEASSSKSKADNVATVKTKNGKQFRLLKTAVVYGANASGKSNLIRGYWAFRRMIDRSFRYDVNDEKLIAEPFELDNNTQDKPSEFQLNFIAWDNLQYVYLIVIAKNGDVIEETLKYYPERNPNIIFRRKGRKIVLSKKDFFKEIGIRKTINPKRLYLSELGNSGDEYWEKMRNYFVIGSSVVNSSVSTVRYRMAEHAKQVFESTNENLHNIRDRLVKFVKRSDLGVEGLKLVEEEEEIKPQNSGEELRDGSAYYGTKKQKRFKTIHNVYNEDKIIGQKEFDLIRQGSTGTIAMFGLSTEILMSLEFPIARPIWIDELDNSLHPHLCRFLINLFNHPQSNPNNSQLIFATHETTLLEKSLFRKDQIWITSKEDKGCTILYSIYDLDIKGLRDNIPFDKWYLSGKFGGLPKIKEMDMIFDR